MLVATDGDFERPVRIYHWWPGKEWYRENPIPSFLVKEAEIKGSKYLTYTEAEDLNWDFALCCPRDVPSRKMGRKIALGRLAKRLERQNFRLEER